MTNQLRTYKGKASKTKGHTGDERSANGRLAYRNVLPNGERFERERWTTALRPEALAVLHELADEYKVNRCEVVEALLLDPMSRGFVRRYLSELKAARLLASSKAIKG
jgi:DNA-binding transcriptional ArsR family regulator